MTSRKTLFVIVAVGLLLLGAAPRSVSADITGNTYNFRAVWYSQQYQVDNIIVLDEAAQGDFRIHVNNLTPSDAYEYTYTGLNWNPWGYSPYYDEHDGSISFQDNKVYFELDTTDVDEDDLTEDYDINLYPYFSEHYPGTLFFVNPVWSTHNSDWTSSVDDAETQLGVTSVTQSAAEGRFSFQIILGIEYNHSTYNYMSGTATLSFDGVYDKDGVLSSWSLQQLRSASNENHTVIQTLRQTFNRGTGAGAPYDAFLVPAVTIAGVAGFAGLIVGVAIARKYWR